MNLSNAPTAEKILVIKLGALGDFIYALGPMKAIREQHKHAHITLLTTATYKTLGQKCGYFDDVILDPRPKWFQFKKILDWKQFLNAQKFTRVYDLQNNDRTALYFKLFNPKPEWVGAVNGASHQNASPERSQYHAFLGHAATLKIGGVHNVTLDNLAWMQPETAHTLKPNSVLIVAGSAPSRPQKRWPVKHYRSLCAALLLRGFNPVLLGTQSEAEVNNEIASALDVTNLTGQTTIYDLPHLARQAVGAIGNDTGPIHILSVTGMTLLALYDSAESNIIKHGPQGAGSKAIEASPLRDLTSQTVLKEFLDIINQSKP